MDLYFKKSNISAREAIQLEVSMTKVDKKALGLFHPIGWKTAYTALFLPNKCLQKKLYCNGMKLTNTQSCTDNTLYFLPSPNWVFLQYPKTPIKLFTISYFQSIILHTCRYYADVKLKKSVEFLFAQS